MSNLFAAYRTKCGSILARLAPVQIMPVRTRVLYSYATKKKRMAREDRKESNLDWAKALLERNENPKKVNEDEEPHMLHVVYLEKPLKGRPWWEKDIASELGIGERLHQPVILKNIPTVNKLLTEIKHLLRIQPLKFPHGLPEHESDFEHMVLRSNGEMVLTKRLKEFEPPSQEKDESKEMWMLDKDTIKNHLDRKRWDYDINAEFFKPKYEYRFNQDKKMFRYNFNKNVRKYDW